MTAILTGAALSLATPSYGGSTLSGSLTVPAGTTRIVVGAFLSVTTDTVIALTWNGVSMLPAISGTKTTPNSYGEGFTLASPATGTHTLAATFSGSARGGLIMACLKGDTGIGNTGLGLDMSVVLAGAADSSLVLFFGGSVGTVTVQAGPYQNNSLSVALPSGFFTGLFSTQRGYPRQPAWLVNTGTGGVGSAFAVEILS